MPANEGRHERDTFNPWAGKIPWRRTWQHTPACLPGESHGQRSLAGHRPWGRQEWDATEHTYIYSRVLFTFRVKRAKMKLLFSSMVCIEGWVARPNKDGHYPYLFFSMLFLDS